MTPRDQELMDRYIYQVVRRLLREQREEIALELQELISDMMEQENSHGENGASMETILTRLGSPAAFAGKYQDTGHYLIGPEYYDTYLWFLKIVMLCAAIPILVVSILEGVFELGTDPQQIMRTVTDAFWTAIVNSLVSCVGIFGSVTLIFAMIERLKIKIDKKNEAEWSVNELDDHFAAGGGAWSPKSLEPLPHKKGRISRGDSIAGIIFIIIFSILLIFAPHFFSARFSEGADVVVIPFFRLDQWGKVLPLLIFSLILCLADESVKLITGHYCRLVAISSIVTNVLQMIISFLLFKVYPFWNPDFATDLELHLDGRFGQSPEFAVLWNSGTLSNLLLGLIFICSLAEMGNAIYKTVRYGVD